MCQEILTGFKNRGDLHVDCTFFFFFCVWMLRDYSSVSKPISMILSNAKNNSLNIINELTRKLLEKLMINACLRSEFEATDSEFVISVGG